MLNLTEAEVVGVVRKHVEGLFPKTCNSCQKVFASYRDYLLNTEHVGIPISYDIETDNAKPKDSSGNLAFANCRCGNTLAISSKGMPLMQIWQVLSWVKAEAGRRGVKMNDMILYLRDAVEKEAQA